MTKNNHTENAQKVQRKFGHFPGPLPSQFSPLQVKAEALELMAAYHFAYQENGGAIFRQAYWGTEV
jgi:hypothetical protein